MKKKSQKIVGMGEMNLRRMQSERKTRAAVVEIRVAANGLVHNSLRSGCFALHRRTGFSQEHLNVPNIWRTTSPARLVSLLERAVVSRSKTQGHYRKRKITGQLTDVCRRFRRWSFKHVLADAGENAETISFGGLSSDTI